MGRVFLLPLIAVVLSVYLAMKPPIVSHPITVPFGTIDNAPYQTRGDLYVYLDAMALRESNFNDTIVNRYGYMGRYQFGHHTLYGLGRQYHVSRREFLENEILQDSAMIANLRHNEDLLRSIIDKYDGHWYNGMYVTKSGILAGAHLVGPQGVIAYFNPRYRLMTSTGSVKPKTKDGNGTTIEDYIRNFSGYALHLH